MDTETRKENRKGMLITSAVAVVGQVFTLGVLLHQAITNMFGFWFWFTFISTMGWAISIALLRTIMETYLK